MKKAFETETQNINTAKIISQIRELNPSLTEHIRRQVDQVHIEYDKKHDLPELLSITQGHDFWITFVNSAQLHGLNAANSHQVESYPEL